MPRKTAETGRDDQHPTTGQAAWQAPQTGDRAEPDRGRTAVRWPLALIVGTVLTVLNVIWSIYMNEMWNQGAPTSLSIYFNVVFTTLAALVLSRVLRRLYAPASLTRSEILIVFVMATVGVSVSALVMMLTPLLAYPHFFGASDPIWGRSLVPSLPWWTTVSDTEAVRAFYLGRADLWNRTAIEPWLPPFIGWGVFVAAMVWTGVAMSALVYNHWRHQERLPFPVNQIPLMMVNEHQPMHCSWLLWFGIALSGGLDIANTMHSLFPSVPGLWVKRAALPLPGLPAPWNALDPLLYSLNPFLIGLEYFLPLDLLFSIFFFYWMGRAQGVALSLFGMDLPYSRADMVAPYVREQAFGAVLALAGFSLWASRGLWRESWTKHPRIMPLRLTAVSAVAGLLAMAAVLVAAGMPGWMALFFILILTAMIFSFAHIRTQYGPPAVGIFLAGPGPALYNFVGSSGLGVGGLASLVSTSWIAREFTYHPAMPTLEAFALTERRVKPAHLAGCIVVAAAAGYTSAWGSVLHLGYTHGYATAGTAGVHTFIGSQMCRGFSGNLSDPVSGPHIPNIVATSVGAGLTLLLQSLRTRFAWFPLHPVGYALSSTYTSTFLWSTALITWAFKSVWMRYTGLKGYHRAAPFFLGLLLGEFVAGSVVSLVGMAMGVRLSMFWPY